MTTSKYQEMNSGLSTDRKELLIITHMLIEADSHTCLKTLLLKNRGKCFNEKESYDVIKPNLQTSMKETHTRSRKSLRGVTPDREEDEFLLLKQILNRYATNSSTTSICMQVVQGQVMCAHVQAHYRPCAPLQLLKKMKANNQALARSTSNENQNPLKTQKLTLTEKDARKKANLRLYPGYTMKQQRPELDLENP
jgi:hypothetical protein